MHESVIIEINPEKTEKLSKLAGVEVIIGDGSEEQLLMQAGLRDAKTFISLTNDDDVNYRAAAIAKKHERYLEGVIMNLDTNGQPYYPDCIVIDHEELGILDKIFKRSVVLRLIKSASCPVLVARTFRYYETIIAILDSSDTSETVGRYAVQMAHMCSSDLHLLILEEVPDVLIKSIKKWFSST